MLSQALGRFTNLELLNIDSLHTHVGIKELESSGIFDTPSEGNDFVTKDLEYTLSIALQALTASNTVVKTFQTRGRKKDKFNRGKSVLDVHDGCIVQITSSKRLVCEVICQMYPSLNRSQYGSAFHKLRTLNLGTIGSDKPRWSTATIFAIGDLINVAPCLETIKIGPILNPKGFMFEKLFCKELRLEFLHSLDLNWNGCLIFDPENLVGFLANHSANLVHVHFSGMGMVDLDWFSILAGLKKLTFPILKLFRLDCCGLVDDDRDVKVYVQDYILRFTNTVPFKPLRKRSDSGSSSVRDTNSWSAESSSSSDSSSQDRPIWYRSPSPGLPSDTEATSPESSLGSS